MVSPIVLGNKEKIRNRGGLKGRQKGIFPRIADGRGWKPGNEIGVIRGQFH
jgi:hypothetical protein